MWRNTGLRGRCPPGAAGTSRARAPPGLRRVSRLVGERAQPCFLTDPRAGQIGDLAADVFDGERRAAGRRGLQAQDVPTDLRLLYGPLALPALAGMMLPG